MMFGYIGYIWAMFGCCTLVSVFGGSAAFLYGLGRRREREAGGTTITVERVEPGAGPGSNDGGAT